MRPRVVLVTGVAHDLGSRVAGALARSPGVERVLGVDVVAPGPAALQRLGSAEFVRVDLRNPLIARVVADAGVDTVVHLGLLTGTAHAGGRAAVKEANVLGTMQLLAACQKAPELRRLVVRSTTAVYGSGPTDPAVFGEDSEPRSAPRSGYAKDAGEVEGYVRGFARRRPDVVLSLLRLAPLIGPTTDTALTRYLTLPVVPTVLGFDPRLQLCHRDDAAEVVRRCAVEDHPGVLNVAGAGVLLLSQAVRRLGRPALPVPGPAVPAVARLLRRAGLGHASREQVRFLQHGRVADVARLRAELGWGARPTEAAFETFAAEHRRTGGWGPAGAVLAERAILDLAVRRRRPSPQEVRRA